MRSIPAPHHERLSAGKPSLHDGVCFHCQQAAEKYLKALLQDLREPIPHTHDLVRLLNLLLPHLYRNVLYTELRKAFLPGYVKTGSGFL